MAQYHKLTAVLIFALAVFEASTNIFLPSLCVIQDFHHTTPSHIQLTVSAYLLGFGVLGLIGGPLSDSIGRKRVMIGGLLLFWVGSLLSLLFAKQSLNILILARIIQGAGAGTATVLSMAIIKDLFDEITAARIFSVMGMVIAVVPMLAPILGGAIADYYDWEFNFTIMFMAASITLLLYLKVAEESHFKLKSFRIKTVGKTYLKLLKHKHYLFYALTSMLLYGALFAWIVRAPFYFRDNFQLTNFSYAFVTAFGPVMYMVGSFLNFILLPRLGIIKMTAYGLSSVIIASIILMLITIFVQKPFWLYIGGFLIFSIGMAPVFANAPTKALEGEDKGAASALLSSFEQSFAALSVFIVSQTPSSTMLGPIVFMAATGAIAYALFKKVSKMDE